MIQLNDTDPMPWGKYKRLPMQDVPAYYLFFFWTEKGLKDDHQSEVADYIRRNLDSMKMDFPDGIWD